jgi:glycosyltransferase involved in cell wall biosynthesis
MKLAAARPTVSVICLCYNHEKFVPATLASVWQQTYPDMEVIIVDDGSKDDSVSVIRQFLDDNPADFPVKTLFLEQNAGNCSAFNQGWREATGKYIVDLATDDIMLPERLEKQVAYFEALPEDYGVIFTESQYIDEDGNPLHFHFADQYRHIRPIPTGDVYQEVLSRYFISSPTMMYRQEVLQRLNGYDEQLAYEDFDFWVRSARDYKYAYLDECTTLVRKSSGSMSRQLYKRGNLQLYSTLLVCRKAAALNQTSAENQALAKRLLYEAKHALFTANFKEAAMFLDLYQQRKLFSFTYIFLKFILLTRIDVSIIYRWYKTLAGI